MLVAERIGQAGAALTGAERRVAEVVLTRPELVAFGTVADLAEASQAGAATVVRLATKVGFDGFTSLQGAVQHELAQQLRPAAERIRQPPTGNVVARHAQTEVDNVRATLDAVDATAFDDAVRLLADPGRRVFMLSGDASRGVATQFVGDLAAVRDDVGLLDGNDVAVRRSVALLGERDVVVTLDLRRYDRWVIDAATLAGSAGVTQIAIVDSVLSPLAALATRTFTVVAAGVGPFDSHVGTLALLNALATGVATALRSVASDRLAAVEQAWTEANALTER
jgi:DNA-binding MurR/RpiR family transcriptional regulator